MSTSSFAESIIIPLSLYEKCKFAVEKKPTNKTEEILEDPLLPNDIKMKLLSQEKGSRKTTTTTLPPPSPPKSDEKEKGESLIERHIISTTEKRNHPFVKSILEIISRHREEIRWDDQFELNIDGQIYANSNIIDIFRFLMKKKSTTPAPIGAWELKDKLISALGIPSSWIPATQERISKKDSTRARSQSRTPSRTPKIRSPIIEKTEGIRKSSRTTRGRPKPKLGFGWLLL
jgi:hypothetical protein